MAHGLFRTVGTASALMAFTLCFAQTPSWPYGGWALKEFVPNGWQEISGSTYPWLAYQNPFTRFINSRGYIILVGDPYVKLQWSQPNGLFDMAPSKLFVRLKPTAHAQIPKQFQYFGPIANVGRFSVEDLSQPSYIVMKGYGPLYKETTPDSSGVAVVPPIHIQASGSSNAFGQTLCSLSYGWEVLSPLLITQFDIETGNTPIIDNFYKGQNGLRERSIRDGDGKLNLHVVMQRNLSNEWVQSIRLGIDYGDYTNPVLELEGENPPPNTYEYVNPYWNTATSKRVLFVRTLPNLEEPAVPGSQTYLASVRDLADYDAPRIPQQMEVTWHYPHENWDVPATPSFEYTYHPCVLDPDYPDDFTMTSPGVARGKVLYANVHTYTEEDLNGTLKKVIGDALDLVDFWPFQAVVKALGYLVPEDLGEHSHKVQAQFEMAWSKDYSFWWSQSSRTYVQGARPSNADLLEWDMTPGAVLKYEYYPCKADDYSYNGFQGRNDYKFAEVIGHGGYGYFKPQRMTP